MKFGAFSDLHNDKSKKNVNFHDLARIDVHPHFGPAVGQKCRKCEKISLNVIRGIDGSKKTGTEQILRYDPYLLPLFWGNIQIVITSVWIINAGDIIFGLQINIDSRDILPGILFADVITVRATKRQKWQHTTSYQNLTKTPSNDSLTNIDMRSKDEVPSIIQTK